MKGTNMTDTTPDEGPVTFIDTFVAQWKSRSRLTGAADGFISAELHRAIDSDTRFKVINVSKWERLAQFRAATQAPEFRSELDTYAEADDSTWTPNRGFYRAAATIGQIGRAGDAAAESSEASRPRS
jgi:heme-degrading monooxygenase HmoA